MQDRSETISRLRSDLKARASYIRAKLTTLVPSQIKALRLKSNMPRQSDLARAAKMHQSRISMFETPGQANLTLETLSRVAAALNAGVIVQFVPFSEMLDWENNFNQDAFDVLRLEQDRDFLLGRQRRVGSRRYRINTTIKKIGGSASRVLLETSGLQNDQSQRFLDFAIAGSIRVEKNSIGIAYQSKQPPQPISQIPKPPVPKLGEYEDALRQQASA